MSIPQRQPRSLAASLQWLIPALLVASLMVVFYPVPAGILDVMLAANITISLVMLLTAIYTPSPLDLTMFPTLLLATALGRVILNFASTRLILTHGAEAGTEAAGGVIRAFGEFVAGGDPAVGFILFLILVVIQFVVVTKGSSRIGEVAARFALDGMPGRQMAVDADLSHGAITADEALRRRRRITLEADFYGAMDGAGKFVRGDAVAGLIITAVNILGGLAIGVFEHGMTVAEAAQVFSVLTIGDGLVSQVPAFLVSVAAGLMMTRTSENSNVPETRFSSLDGIARRSSCRRCSWPAWRSRVSRCCRSPPCPLAVPSLPGRSSPPLPPREPRRKWYAKKPDRHRQRLRPRLRRSRLNRWSSNWESA